MKKIFSWGMMLAAAFTLTNCAKEIDTPVQEPESVGYPFEIVASTVDTKTVNEGMSTEWKADDQINLIHKESENPDASYVYEAAFSIASEDLVDGRFTGTLANPLVSGNHDWYVLYPYSSFTKSPEKSGYLPIGCEPAKSQVQIQEGNSSMAHIAGPNYPLWGNVKGVAHDEKPEVPMSHVSSLIKVVVTNATETPLTVENIAFTAPVDIVGTYYINFAGENVECTNSGTQYVSKTATLNVNNGEAIEAGGSAEFYLAVRPFTAEAGTSLSLAVNGYSKVPKALANAVTFHAGKIKTLNFSYDKVEAPAEPEESMTATLTFDDAAKRIVSTTTQQVWAENDITLTYNKADYNNNLAEYEKPVRFYANTTISLEAPGNIESIEFACNTTAYATALNNAISGSSVNGKIVTVTLDGSSSTVTYKMTAQVRMDALTVKYAKVDPSAPSITAGNVTGVSARGVEADELTYEIANLEYSDLTVKCDGTVVTSASKGEDGVINYVVSVNPTTSARDGYISISNGTLVKEVKVSQLAPKFTVSRNDVELGATKDSKTTVTVTSDFDWTLSYEGTGYTVTPDSYTWDEDGKETVAIQATASRTEEGVAELGTITLVNTTGQKLTIKVTQATSYESEDNELVTETITGTFTHANKKLSLTTTSGITIVQQIASGSTAVNASYNTATTLRVYKGHSLTFSGKTITKIEIFHSSSYKGNSVTASTGTYTQGTSSSVWTGDSDNVVITNTGAGSNVQLRPTKIVVTYKN